MNSDISLRYRQFFDLEAEVDDLDEDSEGQQGAKDDDDDNTSATHSGGVHLHPVATGDEETEDVDQYMKELTERARKRRHIEHTEGNHDEDSHNTNKTSYKTSLWRVWCKHGSQDHLVNVLTRRQHDSQLGLSGGAVTSHLHLYPSRIMFICHYLQGKSHLPGSSSGQADTLKVLQSKSLEEGNWIVVKTGPYHSDVGCIRGIFEWGLDVLVVPRFIDLEFIHVSKKMQRHTKHNLLGPGGNPYVFGMNTHCLAITKPRFNEKTKAPCPREWLFEEEEEVEVLSQSGSHDRRQGKIVVVASHHVEVLLDAGKGLHRFPFYQVVKLFCIGDYVHGIDGLKEGFIQSCSDFHVVLLTMGDNGDFEVIVQKCNHHLDGRRATMTSMAQTMFGLRAVVTLHKNSITNYTLNPDHLVDERMGQSLLYTVKSCSVSELKGSGKTPWIGTRVVIHGKSGPLRTKIGIVRDVICGQSNKSGLCVVLILDNYDPSLTNKEYTVDYEHVLEVTTLRPLRLFQPLKDSQSAFLPKPQFIRSSHEEAIASAAATQRGMIQLECPESLAEHLDPAWDPRSPAPAGLLPTPDLPNSSAFEHHDHWVTDICLLTYRLHVQASGKPMTMMTEYNALLEKVKAYIHKGKKKKKVLESYQFVQPMEPSTPHHYDRWIVIKGDHAGKQVRSIRYDKGLNPKMPIWWMVAVVLPSDDDVDTVTREELCIESTCLCLEDKSAESKKRNMQLSRGLREEAPKSSHQQPQCPSTFSSFAAH
ncbi:hypothetical protein IW261DRAFT_1423991 [Armillaria novae-zelandiae]|uniref:Uncharacterized protein n=1 Tax=Armillaria novae-zelandiae TaxID=153914 RepID=A0AA39NW89_9AGAR|nr:hypothetical protein IW261DRAFT_1423991 [Armillaria novae-zelandiae]